METVHRNVQMDKVDVRQLFAIFFRQLNFLYSIFQRITTTVNVHEDFNEIYNSITREKYLLNNRSFSFSSSSSSYRITSRLCSNNKIFHLLLVGVKLLSSSSIILRVRWVNEENIYSNMIKDLDRHTKIRSFSFRSPVNIILVKDGTLSHPYIRFFVSSLLHILTLFDKK